MSNIRVEKKSNFTVLDNTFIFDDRLSNRAKGLFTFMMALPPTWDYTVAGLLKFCTDRRDAVNETLKELERAGYLVRSRIRDKKGRLTKSEYVLYETPRNQESVEINGQSPKTENPLLDPTIPLKSNNQPITDNPTLDYPVLDEPMLGKPEQLNTKGIKDLNNQALNKSNGGSSRKKERNRQELIVSIDRMFTLLKNISLPKGMDLMMLQSFDRLLLHPEKFTESGITTNPDQIAEILEKMSDDQIVEVIIIPSAEGYCLMLESGQTIKDPRKLMMKILSNAIDQHEKTTLALEYIKSKTKQDYHQDNLVDGFRNAVKAEQGGFRNGSTWNLSD